MIRTHTEYETAYHIAMDDYAHATTDRQRDDALMFANWALVNLADTIQQLRASLMVPA